MAHDRVQWRDSCEHADEIWLNSWPAEWILAVSNGLCCVEFCGWLARLVSPIRHDAVPTLTTIIFLPRSSTVTAEKSMCILTE
jgi:hypothetical protein